MDWIHCNLCYKQPSIKHRQFSLTSCGHFYCDICIKAIGEGKCKICGNNFTTTELSNQMRPDVQEYFQDPPETQRKLMQIMHFQNGHRLRLAAYYRKIEAKYQAAKEDMKKMGAEMQEIRHRNAKLEKILSEYERNRSTSVPATPVMTPANSIRYQPSQGGSCDSRPGQTQSSFKRSQPASQSSQSQNNSVFMTPNRLTLGFKRTPVSAGSNHSNEDRRYTRPLSGSYSSLQRSNSGDRTQHRPSAYEEGRYRNPSPHYNSSQASSAPGDPSSSSPATPYEHRFRSPGAMNMTPRTGVSNSSESNITPLTSGFSLVNLYSRRGQN